MVFIINSELSSYLTEVILESIFVSDIIQPVFNRKPGLVNRLVLPLLWNLLSTSNSGVVTPGRANLHAAIVRICNTLYQCMGEELTELASSKSARALQRLESIIYEEK